MFYHHFVIYNIIICNFLQLNKIITNSIKLKAVCITKVILRVTLQQIKNSIGLDFFKKRLGLVEQICSWRKHSCKYFNVFLMKLLIILGRMGCNKSETNDCFPLVASIPFWSPIYIRSLSWCHWYLIWGWKSFLISEIFGKLTKIL